MAGVIVLDAGVLIAFFDAPDAHHRRAVDMLRENVGADLRVSPATQAEVLVRAAREGLESRMLDDLDALGIRVEPLPEDAGVRLARLRAATGTKLPDCCVILTAQTEEAAIATFDDRLARVASTLGIPALPPRRA